MGRRVQNSKPSRFGTYTTYDNLHFVYKTLKGMDVLQDFKDLIDEKADFMDVKVPNDVFFSNCRKMLSHGSPKSV